QRTIQSWMSSETGSSRNTAVKALGLAKSLHEDLPHTRKALAGGVISEDHAQVLARECTKSPALLERLADPERGERYLVDQPRESMPPGLRRSPRVGRSNPTPKAPTAPGAPTPRKKTSSSPQPRRATASAAGSPPLTGPCSARPSPPTWGVKPPRTPAPSPNAKPMG